MALSDSTFLLDISVEQVKPFKNREEFTCKAKFADLFELYLLELKGLYCTGLERLRENKSRRGIEHEKGKKNLTSLCNKKVKTKFGQTLILINKDNQIIANMKNHNLELSFWSKTNPYVQIGTSIIPWTQSFQNYLKNISVLPRLSPVVHKEVYKVVNSMQCTHLGAIKTTIKFISLASNFYKFISASKKSICIYRCLFSNPEIMEKINKVNKISNNTIIDEEQTIKTDFDNLILNSVKENKKKTVVAINDVKIKNEPYDVVRDTKIDPSFMNTPTELKLPTRNKFEERKYNAFDYIFGDPNALYKNRIYHVNYFTFNNKKENSTTDKTSISSLSSESIQKKELWILRCNNECPKKAYSASNIILKPSRELLSHKSSLVKLSRCKEVACDSRVHQKPPERFYKSVSLDFTNVQRECCNMKELTEKIEKVSDQVSARVKYEDDHSCYCTCECRFGFFKKTTYCTICGGYEVIGEDLSAKLGLEMPIPCPIFHKLDKNKLKTLSTSGSESKKKGDDSLKSIKMGSQKGSLEKRLMVPEKKNVESEKEYDKDTKNFNRRRFGYGYKAPHIGHGSCATPCVGLLDNVPKSMGWFWTADDIPGMKYRPMWKPGAASKQVVRKLNIARNPTQVLSKKKRKEQVKNKRPLKRPLLVVHKVDGEYTVTMETMKTFAKPRAIHQHPYEDKPVLTYTIGRTEEENLERKKKKDREQRRLERAQRLYIQSTFKNMCNEICLKTYQQALGILPNAEDPECSCYHPISGTEAENMNVESCSCSEASTHGSDTDSDEWVFEFTPPNALFDPSQKQKKTIKTDNCSQYTYLDYRVKLVDRYGNTVPRFFKGPDGKEQCSDLGGFYGPNNKWLEINVDGYIAPDGRWAPNSFLGPHGEHVDIKSGKFQDRNGRWLVVGVDGYVNCLGKWQFYSKYSGKGSIKQNRIGPAIISKHTTTSTKIGKDPYGSESNWSCFGNVSPTHLTRLGIKGHGKDKKFLMAQFQNMAQKEKSQEQSKVKKRR